MTTEPEIKGRQKKRMIIAVVIMFQLLGVMSAVHAVMSSRTPQGSIAWAVSLLTFPYVAVPAYWVFGRDKFNGYVLARQDELQTLDDLIRQAKTRVAAAADLGHERSPTVRAAEKMARLPMTGSNKTSLLIDGKATFSSIFEGIDAAEDYILVQFYIVRDDTLGRELQSRLINKARSGVRVYFIYDEIGSFGLPDRYNAALREAGVQIRPFHSRKGSGNRFQLNFRNHRKTVVVDGKVAWIGGHNVGDEYLGTGSPLMHWRDTHARIEGPAVIGAQLAFVEDWRWSTDNELKDLSWIPQSAASDDAEVLIIASGPADDMETASLMYHQAINSATERIWIASPYFVPDDSIVKALQLAGLRGLDVRILIPEKSDSKLVTLAGYSFFNEISAAGVNFYRYQGGFLHEKVMLIDNRLATVGTANFDNRSFRLNFEITTIVVNDDFANDIEKMFEIDFAESRLMVDNEFNDKSFWFKLAVQTSRLAAPIL